MVNKRADLFKQLSLRAKLILIGLLPTLFFLYVSLQYYQAEKQKATLLQNNIRLINRAEAVNKLIEQLRIERRYGFEYALKKDQYNEFVSQWKITEAAIAHLEKVDPELKGIKTYTMLDGLDKIRQTNTQQKLSPDAVMGYYTTTIFRISYLDATPELLIGNVGSVNYDIRGLKALSQMNIYLAIINSNIYNVLYTHKNAVGTLYGLTGLYQLYNTFEKELILRGSPDAVNSYRQVRKDSALKPVLAYLEASFKRMNVDSTYNNVQWWTVAGRATNQLKTLQLNLSARVNNTLVGLEKSERAKVRFLLILLIISLVLVTVIISYTIGDITATLTELRIAAEKIAVGDTGLVLGTYADDVIGRLAGSVAKIDENNKMLAIAANAIGSGNFDVPLKPRGTTDLLGNSLLQMKEELQRFTAEKLAHTAELERLVHVIKQSETHFRQIADQAPLMIWQVDLKAEAVYVNRQWVEFTGISFEDSMRFGWLEALHPEERKNRAFGRAFADRVAYQSKSRFKNAKGEYRWMYIHGTPIFNRGFEGFIGSLTDITDQITAEQAILDLMHKKDEFLSIASHELKTPLTSIKAYTQLLHKNVSKDDKLSLFVTKTLVHVGRLEKLIRDLLDVSRINSGQMDYDIETFEFSDLLNQSVESFSDITVKHTIVIKNIATGNLKADRVRIEQVFNNLLNNAAKYSPDADTILVDSFIDDGFIVVSIQDYGVGIPKTDWGLLFDRFYRSEKTSTKFQGLGLGLFISADIIKRHNGEIWVDSEPGVGSTFYFKLPIAAELEIKEI